MNGFIQCLLLFALFMLGLYCENREKKRKEHESWIYQSERNLLNISDRFEQECSDVTEDTFEKYVWNVRFCEWYCDIEKRNSQLLSAHKRTIEDLRKDYTENLAEKYSNGYSYRKIDDLPTYLIEEYNQRIEKITFRYRQINFTMMMRIRTISPENINETTNESNRSD